MPWARLDDGFDDDPDQDIVGLAGVALFVCSITWASRNLTDGHVPAERAKKLPGGSDPAVIALLLDSRTRWWVKVAGGYQVRNFLKYNPSARQVLEERRRHAERQASYAQKKRQAGRHTAGKRRADAPDDGVSDNVTDAVSDNVIAAVTDSSNDACSRIPYPVSRNPDSRTTTPTPSLAFGAAAPDVADWGSVVVSLVALGVSEQEAGALCAAHSGLEITDQIRWLQSRNPANPAAMLVSAIRGKWSCPQLPGSEQDADDGSDRVEATAAASELKARLEVERRAEIDAAFAALDAETQNAIRIESEERTRKIPVFARRPSGRLFEAAVRSAIAEILTERGISQALDTLL